MSNNKDVILIFGRGQIGNMYYKYFSTHTKHEVHLTDTDITDPEKIKEAISRIKPTVVINSAGKTNLEWIKDNRLEAFNVNVLGADNLAQVCDAHNIYYIYLSSGCIFESKNEKDLKTEISEFGPASYYSFTKIWAEQLISFKKSKDFKYLILRPRQPISSEISNKNMLVKLLTFTKYVDTPNTGTILEDLMVWTKELMEKRVTGIVNAANAGWSTPYKIAHLLKKYIIPDLNIEMISKKELDSLTPVTRVDTILDVSKLKSLVNNVRDYEDALEDVIKKLANNFKTADREYIKSQILKTVEQTKQRATPNNVWHKLFDE